MGDDDGRAILTGLMEGILNEFLVGRIQRASGFVQKKKGRAVD